MTNQPSILLPKLISQSEQLLVLAHQFEWQQFGELEQQRQQQLAQLDLSQIDVSEAEHQDLKQKMAILIDLNEQITAFCQEQRDSTAIELKKLQHGRKAKSAYS